MGCGLPTRCVDNINIKAHEFEAHVVFLIWSGEEPDSSIIVDS